MTTWKRTSGVKLKSPCDLKIGVVTEMLPETKAVNNVELLLASFRRLGTQNIRKISISSVLSALKAYYIISMVEASSCLARYGGVGSVPAIIPADLGFAHKTALARELGFGSEVKQRLVMGTALSSEKDKDVYGQAQMMREALRREIAATFNEVDLLVCPTAATGPPLLEHVLDPASVQNDEWSSDVLTVPASLAGIPAISIPVGPNDTAENTIGVQLMAPFGHDEELLHYTSLLK